MSQPSQEPVDLRSHDLSWLLSDAIGLFHFGRKPASLLLLLCAVDAIAKRTDPTNSGNAKRFIGFLKSRLPRRTRVQNFFIPVPKHDEMCRLEYILYKYLRNPMVHEGAQLDMNRPSDFAVCIDWSHAAPSVRIDDDCNKVFLGGDWIVDVLGGVVIDGLSETLPGPKT